MDFLKGKRGLVFGIANDRSYAWYIAKAIREAGGECLYTFLPMDTGKMEHRCRLALRDLGETDPWLEPCDATNDYDIDAVFEKIKKQYGKIDFIVHSIAFCDRQYLQLGSFHKTTRKAFVQAMDTSVYSLIAMGQRAIDVMPDGGSIISMSYYGGEKVIPGYNVMGVAKSALEHSTKYLAYELGEERIRVNTISGGPLRTLAASAVGSISDMFEHYENIAPLRRNIKGDEVGNAAAYLLSDLSSGITGETLHVDAGYNIMGI